MGACILALAAAVGVAAYQWLTQPPLPEAPGEVLTGEAFGIETYVSPLDTDGDGIDDQVDILASARAYVETHPRYKSHYYAGGWPDDGYGVCTDVVAYALLGAGYDLQALVDADIREVPEAYDVETPDANIDYRRVANLRVWFGRHARSLTLDVADIAAWQPGDIVCWDNHIGIVSDRRTGDGRPLVIHHWGPTQRYFEEDALTGSSFGGIAGHWRLG